MPASPSPKLRAISAAAGRVGSSFVRARVVPTHHAGQLRDLLDEIGVEGCWRLMPALPPGVRRYRSAGSTTSSQRVTESRKLATITVSATASARLATTPLTATAAVPRMRRALDRQQRQQAVRDAWREQVVGQRDQPGQQRDAADQQQPDREVGRHRNAEDRRCSGQPGASGDQEDGRPMPFPRQP